MAPETLLPYAIEALNPDGFLVLRPLAGGGETPEDFLCEYANPAAEALLGQGLAGHPLLMGRALLGGLLSAWRATLTEGTPSTRTFTLGEGPEARAVRARAARLKGGGTLAVWLTDVTEEARFVNEMEGFEQRMMGYVDCLPDALLEVDATWGVKFANRQAEKLLGRRREALIGRCLWDVYAGEPGSEFQRQLQRAMGSGRVAEFEERSSSLMLCLGVTAVPFAGGLLVYLRDMTAHRRHEEALRRTSALFNAVLNGCTDAIFTKDLAGRYTRINGAGAKLLGRSVEEVLGRTDAELYPPDAARATAAHDREVLAFRRTFTYEEVEVGPQPRAWLSTKGVLKDEAGTVFGLFGVSREITDRKQMEEALRRNEARVLQALSAASLTMWDLRLPEGVLRWDRNATAHFGLPAIASEEPLASFLARVHPEDRLAVAEQLASCTQSPGMVVLDYRLLTPDGSVRRHILRARSRVEDGRVGRVLGVLADVTNRAPGAALVEAA
ncbi:PAS domain-containing protein [Myxococcaceae bacterium GXIMD 01537]